MRKPNLGVIFHPTFSPADLPAYARKAEAAGFAELWLWDDCFQPGALTCAAIALSATTRLKVGIGLLPATAYNPLFAAMEITSLARAFPGRILPGFGHGVGSWMMRIGAAPQSSLKTLRTTVRTVRRLLAGEMLNQDADGVHLEQIQIEHPPETLPPLYVGGMRPKTLQLAGEVGDGVLLTGMSGPAYVEWACGHIQSGSAAAGRAAPPAAVFFDVKVQPDGAAARSAARRAMADRLPWADVHIQSLGQPDAVADFLPSRSPAQVAADLPDEWLDAFCASGTPGQVLEVLQRLAQAGAGSIIFQPLNGDPDCLDEYSRHLLPRLRETGWLADA